MASVSPVTGSGHSLFGLEGMTGEEQLTLALQLLTERQEPIVPVHLRNGQTRQCRQV